VAYQAEPGVPPFHGDRRERDFVDATLEAGKTYYILVSPRMGAWKARFSLLPIHPDAKAEYSTQSADFKKWMEKTNFVEVTPSNQAWYEKHKADIEEKKTDYLKKWTVMAAAGQGGAHDQARRRRLIPTLATTPDRPDPAIVPRTTSAAGSSSPWSPAPSPAAW
jgi:hypothetical protein